MTGCFITIEGGEGAGKSTMMDRVAAWLESHGHTVVRTREPGGTELAESLRSILLDRKNDSLCSLTELLLMCLLPSWSPVIPAEAGMTR